MLDYIDNLRTTLNYSKIFLSTGNMAVDCVLSSKLTLAKEVNIQTEYSVFLPEKFDTASGIVLKSQRQVVYIFNMQP